MKSRVLFVALALIAFTFVSPVYAEEKVEEGKIDDYFWPEGEYQWIYINNQAAHMENDPSKEFTFTANYDGVMIFWVEETLDQYNSPYVIVDDPSIYSYMGTYYVDAGTVIKIKVTPGAYNTLVSGQDDGTPNDFTYHYPYHAQSGEIMYRYTYVDDGSVTVPDPVETSVQSSYVYTPDDPVEGNPITFTSTSTATGGTVNEYYWYIGEEYVTDAAMMSSWTWTNPPAGTHDIELFVVDSNFNEDSDVQTITVWPDLSWILLDKDTCEEVQGSTPVNRKYVFTEQEQVTAWVKLGDVSGSHTVTFEWTTPVGAIVQTNSVQIPDSSTQGQEFWEEYVVYDTLTSDMVTGNPGDWTIDLFMDGEKFDSIDFTVYGEPTFLAGTDKTNYIMGENVKFEGQLVVGNIPQQYMDVEIQVSRNGQLLDTVTTSTNLDGLFEVQYKVRPIQGSGLETWSYTARAMEKQVEGTIQVLPIQFEVKDIHLVQTSEVPFIDYGGTFIQMLAAGREMGVRVNVRCPSLKDQKGFDDPTVTARLTVSDRGGDSESKLATGKLSEDWTPIDFYLTPSEGWIDFRFTLDPDYQYGDWFDMGDEYIQSLSKETSALGKKMESVNIQFVQVETPFPKTYDGQQLARRFFKQQEDFIKDVYPVPLNNIQFREDYIGTSAKGLAQYQPIVLLKQNAQLKWLSLKAFLDGGKVVGVLPDTDDWWQPGVTGYAAFVIRGYFQFIDEYMPYYTRAVLVSPRANEGVTAHEIAHTLGLNIFYKEEEYQLNPTKGNKVEGLAFKDGRIYNITNNIDRRTGFTTIVNSQADQVYCFMGSNQWRDEDTVIGTWVCEDTAIQLFEALMDPPHIPLLYVQGEILNGTVMFDDFFTGNGLPDPSYGGDYQAQILDADGNVLDEISFGSMDAEVMTFGFVTEFPAETAKIVMKSGETVLAEKIRSGTPPVVTVMSPSGGSYETDYVDIFWEGRDLDGDELRYTIQYSNDDGQNWRTLNTGITDTTLRLNLTRYPGGSACVVKVIATDGFNTGEHISGSFGVANNDPVAVIVNPVEGSTANPYSAILEGYAMDFEALLSDQQLEWYSDIDGFLGYGETLKPVLSAGVHEITLSVTDDEGATDTDSVSITVSQTQVELVDHIVCGGFDAEGVPVQVKSTYTSSETINSLVSLTGVTPGNKVSWVFEGEYQTQNSEFIVVSPGDLVVNAKLELTQYPVSDILGEWIIVVSVDGVELDSRTVIVEEIQEPTGFFWWGGFIGIGLIAALAAGGYMFLKRRKTGNKEVPTPVAKQVSQSQRFCDNCGKPAKWIEEYQRWYCYDCEKYLE